MKPSKPIEDIEVFLNDPLYAPVTEFSQYIQDIEVDYEIVKP